MSDTKKLYIIDGHYQIYRAYHAPFRDLTSPTGEPIKAVIVFCNMLLKLITEQKPDYLAMTFDGPTSELHRRKLFPEYKATRKPMPEDLPQQVTRIRQIVEAMGIPILTAKGYEADDVIATVASKLASENLDVVLVSCDKDLDQLVGEHVSLFDPKNNQLLDAKTILDKKGFSPAEAIEIQTLTGDTSDNIPGVPGVGPKTALKLIKKYGTAQGAIAGADEQTPKLRENLLASSEVIKLSRKLVTLEQNVPIDLDLEIMIYDGINPFVREIFTDLALNRLCDQLDKMGVGDPNNTSQTQNQMQPETLDPATTETSAGDFDYRCIDTMAELAELAESLKNITRLAVDTETTGINAMRCDLVGISLSWQLGSGIYIPIRGSLGAKTLPVEDVITAITPALTSENIQKIGHHLKYDMLVLRRAGFQLSGPMFDTMIAAHVLDSNRRSFKLDSLVWEYLNHRCIPIEDLIGRGKKQVTMDTVPTDIVAIYAAEDADVTLRLADKLICELENEDENAGLAHLLNDLEMPLMPILADMEAAGIAVDGQQLRLMEVELSKEADTLRSRIIELAGRQFNVDSPKQLASILFDEMKLPILKKTKTGPSTDSSVLSELAITYELPALALDYRKLAKLISTYLKALVECINPNTGRIHTSFHQAGTATGRLSSSNPNLQNIPIRTERGRKIRSAFIAEGDNILLSADYSQIELRVLAHLCEDTTMIKSFLDDQDIHKTVAAEVFGVAIDDVTPEMRSKAKGVNFGIVYGQTAFGLAKSLRIGRKQAGEFISSYKKRFPRIDEFLDSCVEYARKYGYVETIFGRRRKVGDVDARNAQQQALARRLAINTVVQGSAADLIKRAMIDIANRIKTENRQAVMLLQIHDELLFEIPPQSLETDRRMIEEGMSGAIKMKIPLKVDINTGKTWMEAK